jgi:hypothetical protein
MGQSSEKDLMRITRMPQEEGIAMKNLGARLQDRVDNVFSLCGKDCVMNNCSSTR